MYQRFRHPSSAILPLLVVLLCLMWIKTVAGKAKNTNMKMRPLAPKPINPETLTYSRIELDGIEVSLETEKQSYRPGERIRYTIQIQNNSGKSIPLIFHCCRKPVTIKIFGSNGQLVWYPADYHSQQECRFYIQHLLPQEIITQTYSWNQTYLQKTGVSVKRIPHIQTGTYIIDAELKLFGDFYFQDEKWKSVIKTQAKIIIEKDENK